MRRREKILSLVVVVALVFVPFPTRISALTALRVVGTDGAPVPGLAIYQHWECYGLSGGGRDSRLIDTRGIAEFPPRAAYGTVASRAFGRLLSGIAVHASYGGRVYFVIEVASPRKVAFRPPAFQHREPFATSGSYLDKHGYGYFPQDGDGKQIVSIDGDFNDESRQIIIPLE